MQIKRWNFEFETGPSITGIFAFAMFGIIGFYVVNDRIVFLPAAFLAGVITGLLSSSHTISTNNGIVTTIVGFFLIIVFSTAQYVSSLAPSSELSSADQLFFGIIFFLAEGMLVFFIVLPVGYGGALVIGKIRKKRHSGPEPRDYSFLDE
jgi:hypothetical protein